jgi:segregation and condensation protein A
MRRKPVVAESPPKEPVGAEKSGSEGASPPAAGVYHVKLPSFEGPLDLLLHLVQEHELDIFDIPIAFLSKKYVEYITLMEELNIDVASEYLVMAATLAHIKSKMLLPTPPSGQDDDPAEELDPRAELVRRLLEYQKYRQAAEELGSSAVLGRDVFARGTTAPEADGPAPLMKYSVFKLFDAFQKLLTRVQQTAEHTIDVDRISISERILQLTDRLKGKGIVPFDALFEEAVTRSDLVVTFLALLEMTRLRMLMVHQEGPLAPIEVELTLTDDQETVLRNATTDPLAELSRGDVENAIREQDAEREEELGREQDAEREEELGREQDAEREEELERELGLPPEMTDGPQLEADESEPEREQEAEDEPQFGREPDAEPEQEAKLEREPHAEREQDAEDEPEFGRKPDAEREQDAERTTDVE